MAISPKAPEKSKTKGKAIGKAGVPASTAGEPAARSSKVPVSRAKAKKADTSPQYLVFGTVTYPDAKPAAGLTVIAYDKDVSGKDTLGQPATTDQAGNYKIAYSDADFRKTKKERGGADVVVCVYNNMRDILFTSKKKNNAPAEYELNITAPDEQFVVRGKVTDANQKPLAKVTVRIFDRDLRQEELLDEAVTDDWGNFRFVVAGERFSKADSTKSLRPELIVRAYDGNEATLAESPRIRPDDHEAVIDLTVLGPRLSEWEILTQELLPLLIGQGNDGQLLPPWEINDEDVSFLADETGLEREQVRLWALAAKAAHDVQLFGAAAADSVWRASMSHVANIDPQSRYLEFIAFYGWFRDGQPQDAASLLRLDSSGLLTSLDHAIEQRYIPDISKLNERIRASIDTRRVSEALKPTPEGQPAGFGDAFRSMPQHKKLRLDDPKGLGFQVVSLLLKEGSSPEVQWEKIHELINDGSLFNGIRRTVWLMQLTDGYHPFAEAQGQVYHRSIDFDLC